MCAFDDRSGPTRGRSETETGALRICVPPTRRGICGYRLAADAVCTERTDGGRCEEHAKDYDDDDDRDENS